MKSSTGIVHLVGAGPGDPELITVRGLKLIRSADVILYDRLACHDLLNEAKPDAHLLDVGKKPGNDAHSQHLINDLMIEHARSGRSVVRLKGGDPFVFGRGAEELAACRRAEIHCVIVPGVSSALAAPASAGIAVTCRETARSFAVVTAQTSERGSDDHDFDALSKIDTLIIMMGRANLRQFTDRLIIAGRNPNTPAACIQNATTPAQRVIKSALADIADAADKANLTAPIVTVIGNVVAMSNHAERSRMADTQN